MQGRTHRGSTVGIGWRSRRPGQGRRVAGQTETPTPLWCTDNRSNKDTGPKTRHTRETCCVSLEGRRHYGASWSKKIVSNRADLHACRRNDARSPDKSGIFDPGTGSWRSWFVVRYIGQRRSDPDRRTCPRNEIYTFEETPPMRRLVNVCVCDWSNLGRSALSTSHQK
ncbi:hypothetical protein K0M31_007200 [Melipona bicolor]|uniref:Uncharacterized protein n=1 Tax=Melipona bicolor TaxID=60889 RepID=A0AA40GAX8_9HYME|nr:hypothetical protein K0M31_007200 [Melipona bicolor]